MRGMICLLGLSLLLGRDAELARADSCPVNTIQVMDSTTTTTATAFSLTQSMTCPDYESGQFSGSYDLRSGSGRAVTQYSEHCGSSVSAYLHDVFTLLGPTSQDPITFSVALRGFAYALRGFSSAALDVGTGVVAGFGSPTDIFGATVTIPISRAPGGTFDVYVGFFASGQNAVLEWSIFFPDLPQGYSVVSCQGYRAGEVVPVRPTSWGRLKSIYR